MIADTSVLARSSGLVPVSPHPLARSSVAALALLLAVAACSGYGAPETGTPLIRVANRSDTTLENVVVGFPSGAERYGTIPPHAKTAYRRIQKAYRYAHIEASVDGTQAVPQPIDSVGERPLTSGKYTYALTVELDADTPYQRLRLVLVRE